MNETEGEDSAAATSSPPPPPPPAAAPSATAGIPAASQARAMEAPTGLHRLRGPSPIVWAMRTRVAPPPRLAEPIPRPVYPPPPLPQAPLPPPTERRRRGRPRKVACLSPPPGFGPKPAPSPAAPPTPAAPPHGPGELGGLQPHVLTIAAGEDIISKVMAVSRMNSKAICILSALGAVKEAILLQPSGVLLTHKGPLEIIRLSGSILASNDRQCLRVTLASINCFVVSGVIAGPLIAETPVQAILGSFHNNALSPNNAPRVAVACHPNMQGTIGNGSTLPSQHFNPGYVSRTSVQQNESDEIDIKPFVGMVHPNPEYAPPTPVQQNESDGVDVKPFIGVVSTNPGYAYFPSAEQNGSDEVDVKPFVGVVDPNPEHASFASTEQNASSEISVEPSLGAV